MGCRYIRLALQCSVVRGAGEGERWGRRLDVGWMGGLYARSVRGSPRVFPYISFSGEGKQGFGVVDCVRVHRRIVEWCCVPRSYLATPLDRKHPGGGNMRAKRQLSG